MHHTFTKAFSTDFCFQIARFRRERADLVTFIWVLPPSTKVPSKTVNGAAFFRAEGGPAGALPRSLFKSSGSGMWVCNGDPALIATNKGRLRFPDVGGVPGGQVGSERCGERAVGGSLLPPPLLSSTYARAHT